MKKYILILSIAILSACNGNGLTIDRAEEISVNCPIYESRNWHAWIDSFTKEKGFYRLIVEGEVDLPTPNYEISWSLGITDRAQPPGQRLMLSATPKDNAASIQVITPTKVKFTQDLPFRAYRNVSVYCGERLSISMPDISLTD